MGNKEHVPKETSLSNPIIIWREQKFILFVEDDYICPRPIPHANDKTECKYSSHNFLMVIQYAAHHEIYIFFSFVSDSDEDKSAVVQWNWIHEFECSVSKLRNVKFIQLRKALCLFEWKIWGFFVKQHFRRKYFTWFLLFVSQGKFLFSFEYFCCRNNDDSTLITSKSDYEITTFSSLRNCRIHDFQSEVGWIIPFPFFLLILQISVWC